MTWTADLARIRRYLRDPDGNIWTDQYLLHQWNDIQQDLQNKTSLLEDVAAQRVPDLYHMAYMQDWEWRFLSTRFSEFYQCLSRHNGGVFCHSWEPQEVTGIASDVVDVGSHFTQPWEAYMCTPAEEVRMKFPKNFAGVKFIAYDEEPISVTTRKAVQSVDASYVASSGRPVAYYVNESVDKSYVLYPRPASAFEDEISGEGVAFFVEDDTENDDVGTIAVRTGSSETTEGAAIDVVGLINNVLLIYDVAPSDLASADDESDFPAFLRKYIRYGVLARAYDANTDGRIPSLAKLWANRYQTGVKFMARFKRSRKQDRDYRLTTKPSQFRGRTRHPRLPSTYPAV